MANEIAEYVSGFTSGLGGGAISWTTVLLIVGGMILVAGVVIWGVIIVMNRLKYNKKLKLFRKVGNEIVPVLDDKGWFARVGTAGDQWCKVQKFKKTLPRPRKQMAKDEYWFYEREDGEWVNFSLKDFDEDMKKAGAYFVDEDMRLQRLGIQKNLENRFQKVTFWQKYGGMIMNILFMVIVTVCLVILFKEMKDNWAVGREMASAVRDMAVQVQNLYTRGQSGAVTVGESFLPLLWGFKK